MNIIILCIIKFKKVPIIVKIYAIAKTILTSTNRVILYIDIIMRFPAMITYFSSDNLHIPVIIVKIQSNVMQTSKTIDKMDCMSSNYKCYVTASQDAKLQKLKDKRLKWPITLTDSIRNKIVSERNNFLSIKVNYT